MIFTAARLRAVRQQASEPRVHNNIDKAKRGCASHLISSHRKTLVSIALKERKVISVRLSIYLSMYLAGRCAAHHLGFTPS